MKLSQYLSRGVFLSLFLLVNNVRAQDYNAYFSGGYGFSFGSYKGFDEFVNNYNSTRTWLDKPMPKAWELDGFCFGGGFNTDNLLVDFQWTGRHHVFEASGTQLSGVYGYRQVKYRANTFNIGIGVGQGRPPAKVFFGASLDFGFNHMYTRTWLKGEDKPDFESTLDSKQSLATTIFLDMRFGRKLSFGIKPYYQIHFFKHDFNNEEAMINESNNTFYLDDPKYDSAPNNFGIELKIFLNTEE